MSGKGDLAYFVPHRPDTCGLVASGLLPALNGHLFYRSTPAVPPLSEATDDGHCYLPTDRLVADATKILDVPADLAARWSR